MVLGHVGLMKLTAVLHDFSLMKIWDRKIYRSDYGQFCWKQANKETNRKKQYRAYKQSYMAYVQMSLELILLNLMW